jgi:hypothetical protein
MRRFPKIAINKWLTAAAGLLLVCIVVYILSLFLPLGIDWDETFLPAALELLTGHSPYTITGFFNPFWTPIPILPFAWLPSSIGRAAYLLASLAGFAFAAYRLGAKPVTFVVDPKNWSGALTAIVKLPFETFVAVIGLWILFFLRFMS